jgi:hypothetical protein
MTDQAQEKAPSNRIKDPDDWKTGDEPITGAQQSYLETLATEAHQTVDNSDLTKAEASKIIDELQEKTGRGKKPA